jgi:hypothetical protein
MSELNNQIENRDLAHIMALAEAPQRAIARTAFEVGASEAHAAALKTANTLGIQAGKAYLQEVLANFNLHEQEVLLEANIVRTTEDQLYCSNLGFNRYKGGVRTRSWNALAKGQKIYERHGLDNVLVTEIVKNNGYERTKVIAVNLDERVINILPELEECGKLSQAYIKEFYAGKLAEQTPAYLPNRH